MCAAGVTDVDCALLDVVTRSSVCRAAVNGVLVVEATASRVQFNKLITHGALCYGRSNMALVGELDKVASEVDDDTPVENTRSVPWANNNCWSKQMKIDGRCLPLFAVG